MSLIQRIPWKQQPQVAVPLNPAFALNGYAATAPGQSVLRQPTTPVVLSPLGRMWRANGSEESGISGVNLFPDGTPYTIVALAVANGVSGIQMVACADQTPRVFQLRLNDSAAEFISFNTGAGLEVATTSTGAVVAGAPFVMVATATNSKVSVFCNGKTAATARSNSTVSNNTGSTLEIGGRLSSTYLTGGIYGLVIIPGALSDTQALSLSSNPQAYFSSVFAPLSRRIWAPVSVGGGTYTLTAAAGSYALAGKAAAVLKTRILSAAAGSYSLTGNAASVIKGRVLLASAGSYVVTGKAALIARSRVLSASAGSYAYTGKSATITYVPAAGAYTLTATAGSYAVTGVSAAIRRTRVLSAAAGAYTFAGKSANIIYSGAPPVKPLRPYFDVLSGRLLILRGAAA
jgi:hypothetical protein